MQIVSIAMLMAVNLILFSCGEESAQEKPAAKAGKSEVNTNASETSESVGVDPTNIEAAITVETRHPDDQQALDCDDLDDEMSESFVVDGSSWKKLKEKLSYLDGAASCGNLGSNWRLPYRDEFRNVESSFSIRFANGSSRSCSGRFWSRHSADDPTAADRLINMDIDETEPPKPSVPLNILCVETNDDSAIDSAIDNAI